ncbi:hypothetical protein NPIL_502521 [Nephila pilipes]|uniref:Uncharacterized protein n=1 Tax=Nephila pilipes TaxID=299642 RepID=A0A8X6PB46_NEPPI|nr:hypothetical protein NPIL_502521 [Nephila pilipes]
MFGFVRKNGIFATTPGVDFIPDNPDAEPTIFLDVNDNVVAEAKHPLTSQRMVSGDWSTNGGCGITINFIRVSSDDDIIPR